MKNWIVACVAGLGFSGLSFAQGGFQWCPELTASVQFSCDQWGTLNIRTVARVPNIDGTVNRAKYKMSYDSFDQCLELVKPFQKKFSIVTAPKQAHFALCDKWGTLHTMMIRENATIEAIQPPHHYQKGEECTRAQDQFNEAYPD